MYAMRIDEFEELLVKKIPTAKHTGKGEIEGGSWQPAPKECHTNVDTWCELRPEFKPVRGWFYFNETRSFLFHSVVRKPNGDLADITPSNVSSCYPFIEADLEDEVYFSIEARYLGGLVRV